MPLAIDGPERLRAMAESIAPESACTSVQLHLQVAPESFANYWNAAQVIAGAQLAVGANSPYLFGKELWRETRIALFDQATDTRSDELKEQGVRPRVWFGERWITSIFDLFEENVRYFPALLPICDDEDPAVVLDRGDPPRLSELRLHNGTVYRWNRPVYDVVRGEPHLRVENRVLPAGPTVADTAANAAFYYGLVRVLADDERPLWSRMSFGAADENFHAAAKRGIDAHPVLAGCGRGARGRAGAPAAAADRRRRPAALGRRPGACATGCSASSRRGASPGRTGRPGRSRPCRAAGEAPPGPARRAAGDGAALRRAHALQRAGAHLARGG